MFKNKLKSAEAEIDRLTGLVSTFAEVLGLDLTPDDEAAEGHPDLSAGAIEAALEDTIELRVAEATVPLKDQYAALEARLQSITAAAGAFGIDLTPDDLTEESARAAIEQAIAVRAARQVAQAGHEPLDVPAAGEIGGDTNYREQYESIDDPAEAAAFYAKYRDKILR
ncbi:MAG: hypothetical protein D6781_13115 [Verrucomicrobia bacterium]|nr:MAG: hypothetical protein D6781_13115 [Verrucomicrobiota bacterium]